MNDTLRIAGTTVAPGETRDVRLKVSETYTGGRVDVPIRVARAPRAGPVVFVTAAVHGDELNGTGIIRELMFNDLLELSTGSVILVPVVNLFGFEHHARYMPDRKDLNRSFPGSPTGSLSRRVAHVLFGELTGCCTHGIDLHTAAVRRTNFPNVRGDLANSEVRRLAGLFGCELVVNSVGPVGSLRREACKAGCPTIILEAGEPGKFEPAALEIGIRGVRNVLIGLGMMEGAISRPAYQTRVDRTTWVRANTGGLLRFHVVPGEPVETGQPIATNVNLFGKDKHVVASPAYGIVLGVTTFPTVKPGDPVCQLAIPRKSVASIKRILERSADDAMHHQAREDLATNISVSEFEEELT